jgi:glycosyl transferase, family 25
MRPAPVYVINLDRSTERLAQISAALHAAGLVFERVPAIDASELDSAISKRVYDEHANRRNYLAPLSPQEMACFLSHRRAWQTFLTTRDDPFAVFLEDDAAPLFGDLDLQLLQQSFADSDRAQIIKLYRPRSDYTRLRRPLVPPLGAVAQAMNRAAAEALLKFSERFYEPIDVALQRWWDHGARITVACPLWFGEAAGASTIRSRRQSPHEGRLLREIRRPLFQLRRRLRATMELIQGRYP